MGKMLDDVDRQVMRPVQKASYTCSAKCCDTAKDTEALGACIDACHTKSEKARSIVQAQINDFTQRLQRCMQGCQDQAKNSLPAIMASEADYNKANKIMQDCASKCATDYQTQVPKMYQQIKSGVQGLGK